MPFPSEHAARVKPPSAFIEGSFRRKPITEGIDLIVGRLKDGDGSAIAQSYRFDLEKFTAAEAREWLKEHDVKPILFEEAQPDAEKQHAGHVGPEGPHAGHGGLGGPPAAQVDKAMDEFAGKYKDASVEHGILITPDGEEIELEPGGRGMIPMLAADVPPGSVQFHNHPSESTFSPQDVRTVLSGKLSEMRVVDSAGNRYIMRNIDPDRQISNARITTFVANLNNRAVEHAQSIAGDAGDREFKRALVQSLADQYDGGILGKVGLEYEVVPASGKSVLVEEGEKPMEHKGRKQDERPFQTVDGVRLHAEDFASVGDPDEPGTWKLPLAERTGTVSATRIAGAITALQPGGFRGQHVELTAPKASVVRRISAAIGKLEDEDEQDRLQERLDAIKEVADKSTLEGEVSREQQETAVRRAFDAAIGPKMQPAVAEAPYPSRPWIVDTYTNSVICEWAGKFYEVPFMRIGTEIAFAAQEDWAEVEKREEWLRVAKQLRDEAKAGRRVRSNKVGLLKEIKQAFEGLMQKLADVVGWAEYDDEKSHKIIQGFKTFKGSDGRDWILTWTTNAFEDRDGEIFETKAIEEYVARHEDDPVKGEYQFWHLPGTKFGDIEWQGVSGRFLVEAGPFDSTDIGKAFKAFFQKYPDGHPKIAPEGWGTSHGFKYRAEDRKGGVYRWFEKQETSVLPGSVAANSYNPELEVIHMLNEKQIQSLEEIGGQDLVKLVTETGEKRTQELEQAGVAHKAKKNVAEMLGAMADEMEDEGLAKQIRGLAEKVAKSEAKGSKDTDVAEAIKALAEKAEGSQAEKLKAFAESLQPETPKPEADEPVTRKEIEGVVQVLGAGIANLTSLVKALQETVGAEVKREVKETLEETPRLSLMELAAKSVIGQDATRVDGRKALAQDGPKETDPTVLPEGRQFGIPLLANLKALGQRQAKQ